MKPDGPSGAGALRTRRLGGPSGADGGAQDRQAQADEDEGHGDGGVEQAAKAGQSSHVGHSFARCPARPSAARRPSGRCLDSKPSERCIDSFYNVRHAKTHSEIRTLPAVAQRKRGRTKSGPCRNRLGRLGTPDLRADGDRGGGQAEAEGDQHHRGQTVEKPFEMGETSERHDTHLSSWTLGGARAFSI